jgi:tetratricopeptide (TPR) repeat protein
MKKNNLILFVIIFPMVLMAAQDNAFVRFGSNIVAYFNTYYNAKEYYKEAQELYNEEEDKSQVSTQTRAALNKATTQTETVINKFPRSSFVDDSMFMNSVCQFQLGRYEKALKQLEELTLEFPDSPYYFEAKLWISKCYFQMDKKTIAYDLLEQFLANSKNKAYYSDAYTLIAYLALQEKDEIKALDAFLKAADLALTKEARCNMYLEAVELLMSQDRYDEALKYAERAERNIKFDEQRARVQIAFVRVYRIRNEKAKANSLIEEAFKDARIAQYWGDISYEQANIYFEEGETEKAVAQLRNVVADNTYKRNKDSKAWVRSAFRLGKYYLYENHDIDSSQYFFNQAKTKRRQAEEGEWADDFLESIKQLKKINKELSTLVEKSPALADSAYLQYELLGDSSNVEIAKRMHILSDTLHLDSARVDSLKKSVNTVYYRFDKALKNYIQSSNDYVGQLFSLAGLYLFDLQVPDTALSIYENIEREFYYTNDVPKAMFSQSYVWEYELGDKAKADSIKKQLTIKFPNSDISDHILDRVPQDSLLYYANQEKIFDIEGRFIDTRNFNEAVRELKKILNANDIDKRNLAFIAYKIAWLYDNELSKTQNTKDSTLHYYYMVEKMHSGTPFARKSSLRIAAIETEISEYLAYLAGDSLNTKDVNIDSSLYASNSQGNDVEQKRKEHPIYRRLKSPGRPRPIRL